VYVMPSGQRTEGNQTKLSSLHLLLSKGECAPSAIVVLKRGTLVRLRRHCVMERSVAFAEQHRRVGIREGEAACSNAIALQRLRSLDT